MNLRKIHFSPTDVWLYRLGRGNAVITSPQGKKTRVRYETLTGRSPNTLERGQWKKTSDGMICPSHVKSYIASHREELERASSTSRDPGRG